MAGIIPNNTGLGLGEKKPVKKKKLEVKYRTPSDSPFPVFVMCQPCYVETDIANNIWMKDAKKKGEIDIDRERMIGEWWNFYRIVAADSLVYLLPPTDGLQDQTYVNSFVYLPHIKEPTIVLSNFTAEGRAGEEVVADKFLTSMGYKCVKPPYKFEGFPELKWLRDNIYFGGWGQRTEIEFYDWFEAKYGAKVIRIQEKDEYCYHLDCNLFVIDNENVIACNETIDKETWKEIEKVANVFPVTDDDCYEDICNIVRVQELLVVASDIQFLKKSDPLYQLQLHKNNRLEEICGKMGLEMCLLQMSENAKSGAATSCLVTPLNHIY
jgi:N-dimethylarginine dimethylaminohydrolase